eukprot:scaffold57230_cov84-Phaeocystis_antarctica.AAC.1
MARSFPSTPWRTLPPGRRALYKRRSSNPGTSHWPPPGRTRSTGSCHLGASRSHLPSTSHMTLGSTQTPHRRFRPYRKPPARGECRADRTRSQPPCSSPAGGSRRWGCSTRTAHRGDRTASSPRTSRRVLCTYKCSPPFGWRHRSDR